MSRTTGAGAIVTRRVRTRALARAMATASAATLAPCAEPISALLANPQLPSTRTLTPNPAVCERETASTRPCLTVTLSLRRSTTRTSA